MAVAGGECAALGQHFLGILSPFRVNVQEPTISKVAGGDVEKCGAAFVWQGVRPDIPNLCAISLGYQYVAHHNDLTVSTFTNTLQTTPVLTVLNNSNVWLSGPVTIRPVPTVC